MAVMITDDKKELVVTCECGCNEAIHIKLDDDDEYYTLLQTYMNGNWCRDQNDSVLKCIGRKLKKIWRIIRNKDYCYSEIFMSKDDFHKYKLFINQQF